MAQKLSIGFCGALLASMLLLPMLLRLDSWPWSTYPMFSMAVDVDHIWSHRIYLVNTKSGKKYQLHPFLRLKGIALVSECIRTQNYELLFKLIRAESINWPKNESEFDAIEFYTARKKQGAIALPEIELEKTISFALPQ